MWYNLLVKQNYFTVLVLEFSQNSFDHNPVIFAIFLNFDKFGVSSHNKINRSRLGVEVIARNYQRYAGFVQIQVERRDGRRRRFFVHGDWDKQFIILQWWSQWRSHPVLSSSVSSSKKSHRWRGWGWRHTGFKPTVSRQR